MIRIPNAPVFAGQILAAPLRSAGRRARMTVAVGSAVRANQALAVSESGDGADVCAPAGGKILGVETRRLAAPVKMESECVILQVGEDARAAAPIRIADSRQLLKAAGVLGLGGAAFPAWRKWRDGAKFLIVNAAESDSGISCDAALRGELGSNFAKAAARVGKILGAEKVVVAISDSDSNSNSDSNSGPGSDSDSDSETDSDGVEFFRVGSGDVSSGSERLLVRAIAGTDLAPPRIPADFGIVCFNAATVAAMDEAFADGVPMTGRIVTMREGERTLNIRAPFGMAISRLAEFAGMRAGPAKVGGRRARDFCPADAVVCSATNAIDFAPSATESESEFGSALPCVRCGACVPACPVGLNPMRLHFLNLDSRRDEMRAEKISHCLECGRCDDACPSGIPLARLLGTARDSVAAAERARLDAEALRLRHDRHQRALRRKIAPRPASESAKSSALSAALNRAAGKNS